MQAELHRHAVRRHPVRTPLSRRNAGLKHRPPHEGFDFGDLGEVGAGRTLTPGEAGLGVRDAVADAP